MNRRTAIAAIIAVPVLPKPRVMWVYYSDGPNLMPWLPHWIKCKVIGDKAFRLDGGKGYFSMSHIEKHLYRIEDKVGAKLLAPSDEDSRTCAPRRLPF